MYDINEYYKLLDIEPNSDLATIKRAYRKLSFKYHPDKNNNETNEIFNRISNAYTYLLNKESRENKDTNYSLTDYNQRKNESNNNGCNASNSNSNSNEILPANFSNTTYNILENSKQDIEIIVQITFEEAYNGANIPVNIKRIVVNNNIVKNEEETIYFHLEKGVDNNEIIIIKDKGNCLNYVYSDIKIIIHLDPHELFTRDGLNLVYVSKISFKESLVGLNFEIKHLNNKKYRILNNKGEIIHNTTNIVLDKLGFERDGYKGKLIIKFKIEYPKFLERNVIEKLREIL